MSNKNEVAFPTLEAEIARRGIKKCEIANILGIGQRTLSNKLNGFTRFALEEAIKIKQTWFSEIPIEELFSRK